MSPLVFLSTSQWGTPPTNSEPPEIQPAASCHIFSHRTIYCKERRLWPWSKTQKARGDDVWIPRQEAPLDPIHAIHKHFIKNKLDINHPIAAYRDSHNKIVTLTRSTFVRRANRILRATHKGYPRMDIAFVLAEQLSTLFQECHRIWLRSSAAGVHKPFWNIGVVWTI